MSSKQFDKIFRRYSFRFSSQMLQRLDNSSNKDCIFIPPACLLSFCSHKHRCSHFKMKWQPLGSLTWRIIGEHTHPPVLFKLKAWATFRTGHHTNNNNSIIYMKIIEIWADIIKYFWNMKVLELHKNQQNPRNSEHSVASFSIMKMCRGSWRRRVMMGEVMCFDEAEISNFHTDPWNV